MVFFFFFKEKKNNKSVWVWEATEQSFTWCICLEILQTQRFTATYISEVSDIQFSCNIEAKKNKKNNICAPVGVLWELWHIVGRTRGEEKYIRRSLAGRIWRMKKDGRRGWEEDGGLKMRTLSSFPCHAQHLSHPHGVWVYVF